MWPWALDRNQLPHVKSSVTVPLAKPLWWHGLLTKVEGIPKKTSDSFILIYANGHKEPMFWSKHGGIYDFIFFQILTNSFPPGVFSIGQKSRHGPCCLSITSWEERWPRGQASSSLSFAFCYHRSALSLDRMNANATGLLKSPIACYSWAGWGRC